MSKMWFANNKLSLTGHWKCYFWTFFFFIFPNFKRLFSRMLLKNYHLWIDTIIMDFKGCYEVLLRHKYFWFTNFRQSNHGLFNIFFKIYMEIHFVCLFFSKWKKYCNLHLKCSITHYAKTLLNRKICYFVFLFIYLLFFYFLFMFILTRLLSKTLCKNYRLLTQISNICFKM